MHDLNLLVALDALLESGSVTGAAERLHLSPPAMSRTLARIRRVLDDPVLVRAGRTLVPTPRAVALQARVRTVVAEATDLLRPAGEVDVARLQRTFTIRSNEDVPAMLGPRLLAAVAAEAPYVSLRFVPEGDEDVEDLRQGRIDMDIGNQHDPAPDLVTEDLFEDRFVGVVAATHPLVAEPGPVTPERLVEHDHVAMSRRGLARGPLDEQLEARGLTRRVAAVVPSPSGALALAAAGDLVAVVPGLALALSRAHGDLVSFPLPVPTPSFSAGMAWHRRLDADPTHRWLRGLVRAALTDVRPKGP